MTQDVYPFQTEEQKDTYALLGWLVTEFDLLELYRDVAAGVQFRNRYPAKTLDNRLGSNEAFHWKLENLKHEAPNRLEQMWAFRNDLAHGGVSVNVRGGVTISREREGGIQYTIQLTPLGLQRWCELFYVTLQWPKALQQRYEMETGNRLMDWLHIEVVAMTKEAR